MIWIAVSMAMSARAQETPMSEYVTVSQADPRYFELTDGSPYIPIGLNMSGPPGDDVASMIGWMDRLSENGGNFVRVWLSSRYFDVEREKCGVYDEERARRIDAMLESARERGLRVKLCIEGFRHFGERDQKWSEKSLHLIENGGTATGIADWFDGERSREQFRKKLVWYQQRYGDDPVVFGWELWNEINAVAGGDVLSWTEAMLPELHRLFPKNMAMQSLGSYDGDWCREHYARHTVMPGNDVAQVHRYLDLGAQYEVCHAPMDIVAADAVRELQALDPGRPILLAESGGVQPKHSGPFEHYETDEAGIILHDVLFAPFFTGAAGPGHIWHWGQYVDKNDLWHHFARFAEAVEGIDPAAEGFEPEMIEHDRLRIYVLRGKTTTLAWCRDSMNTWQTELADGEAPEVLSGLTVALGARGKAQVYAPWTDEWTDAKAKRGEIGRASCRERV